MKQASSADEHGDECRDALQTLSFLPPPPAAFLRCRLLLSGPRLLPHFMLQGRRHLGKASLLYTFQEAADIDADTIYRIGLEGKLRGWTDRPLLLATAAAGL